MEKITDELTGVKTVAIAGHIRPDGDCIGSCMGMYLYLKENYPDIETDIYLEQPREGFSYISHLEDIKTACTEEKIYDLFITLDASTSDRIGVAQELFRKAKRRICIDHHVSNPGFADKDIICPQIGSASEVLYHLLEEEKKRRSQNRLQKRFIQEWHMIPAYSGIPVQHRIRCVLRQS